MKWGVYEILMHTGRSYCTRCGRILPVDSFPRDASKRHGLAYHCAECRRGYVTGQFPEPLPIPRQRIPRYSNVISDLQWVLERNGLAYCSREDHILPRTEFFHDAQLRHGLQSHCKACHLRYAAPNDKKPAGM